MIRLGVGIPPRGLAGGASGIWDAWNAACTADGAFAPEAAVNLCLLARFQSFF